MLFPIKKNSLSYGMENISCSSIFSLLLYTLLIWWLAHVISDSNLDKYDDMLEAYSWGSLWSWGHDKHPPLFGWIAAAWFQIFPHDNMFFYLLSYAVVALGLLGVFCLTPLFLRNVFDSAFSSDAYLKCCKKLGFLSVALLLLSFPYTTLAAKYNANSILLMLWPWTIYFFLRATHKSQRLLGGLLNSLFLGFMAALSMLGKYFSGILLVTLFFVSLLPLYRNWYRSFSPYLSLLIFCICLAPHFYWLTQNDYPTLVYLQTKGDGKIYWILCLKFLFAPLLYWCIPWYWVLLKFFEGPWYQRMLNSWRAIHLGDDALWWIAILPFILTVLAGFLGFVKLTYPWAIPLGFGFPLLWLRNSLILSRVEKKFFFQPIQLKMIGLMYFYIIILIAVSIRIYAAHTQDSHYYLPQKEAAADIFKHWQELYPSEKPSWIVAEKKAATLSFYNKSWARVKVYPSFPSDPPASYNAVRDWNKGRGVIYCFLGQNTYSVQQSKSFPCIKKAAIWLQQQGYTDIDFKIFQNHREGLLFPKPLTFSFAVFFAKREKN